MPKFTASVREKKPGCRPFNVEVDSPGIQSSAEALAHILKTSPNLESAEPVSPVAPAPTPEPVIPTPPLVNQ